MQHANHRLRNFRLALSALAGLGLGAAALGNPNEPPTGGQGWAPKIKPASPAAEEAIRGFKVAPGLTVSLWAAEPMLCNPNAICQDSKGNIFVAETNRYSGGGTIDVRAVSSKEQNWLTEDIACRTVADRLKMIERHAKDPSGREALHSPNAERIIELRDTTGSGKADVSTVFADEFDKPEDGLGSGILAWRGNIYYTCIPSLYVLRDTKGVGRADEKKALSTGYGVRYAFLGHDLHGLVMGPDGKLYFSEGDRGANVDEPADKRHVENIEAGGVFRCNPDGTGLELFATGLRNPQELRFDQYGNLFTGDNNPDKGDPARWVYVVQDGDSGWREGYQADANITNGGPWMSEQIWSDASHNNAHYINPCIQGLGAGPAGLAYYPGTGLPAEYNNHFFLCDFRGGPGNSGIWSLLNKPDGASFKLVGDDGKPINRNDLAHHNIIYHVLATDVEYANGGGMYISDWINGWGRPNAGRIYRLFDEKAANDPVVLETKKLIAEGMQRRTPAALLKLLEHPDMRVRQDAQFALADEGAPIEPALTSLANKADEPLLPRLHAIWALGQIADRTHSADPLKGLIPLLGDKELEVRCQAAKVLGEAKAAAAEPGLLELLKGPEARGSYFAAMALGKIGDAAAVAPLIEAVKANAEKDATLRYGLVDALSKLKDAKVLEAAVKDPSPSVRLAAVLTLRKLGSEKVADFLDDSDRTIVLEAARAINDLPIVSALPRLAALLDKPTVGNGKPGFDEKSVDEDSPHGIGDPSVWVQWRAVNANYRVGSADCAKRLADFAARSDAPSAVRVEALRDLGDWAKPSVLDRITNLWRPLPERDGAVAKSAAQPVIGKIAQNAPDDVRVAATKLMAALGLGDARSLTAMVDNKSLDPKVRAAALATLADLPNAGGLDATIAGALKDSNAGVRREAILAMGRRSGATSRLGEVLDTGSIGDKQAAFDALGQIKGAGRRDADKILTQWMGKLLDKQVPLELQLNLLEAAGEQKKDKALAADVRKFDSERTPADKLAPYRECESGGDPEEGRAIFFTKAAVSCVRCHMAEGQGGVVGPRLDGVGARQTREYLLESIVDPNAKIAPGFETVVIKTKEGKFRTGVLKRDTPTEIELLNPDLEPDKQKIVIAKSDIESRKSGPSAMPEGLVKALTKRELRDLVAYLASLKTEPKGETPLKHGA